MSETFYQFYLPFIKQFETHMELFRKIWFSDLDWLLAAIASYLYKLNVRKLNVLPG